MSKLIDELSSAQTKGYDYAVFSGGGAKGAAYSGVYETLVETGISKDLKSIAGSSAGALTAAFIACGISTEDFKKTFSETSLGKLQGGGIIQKDAKPLYTMIHDTINNTITKHFQENDVAKQCDARIVTLNKELETLKKDNSPESKQKIELLIEDKSKLETFAKDPQAQANLNAKAQNKDSKVTFRDLDLLHTIDPDKFKGLIVTATNKKTGNLTIFDAKNSPDVEIALACRASASIPGRFKPVVIDGINYVDGGYRNNIPQNFFEKNERDAKNITNSSAEIKEAKDQGRTLAIAFGSDSPDSEAHIAVYIVN